LKVAQATKTRAAQPRNASRASQVPWDTRHAAHCVRRYCVRQCATASLPRVTPGLLPQR
jgi:hypothetical protein